MKADINKVRLETLALFCS